MVTRACDKACFGCTQGSNLAGKPIIMTPENFERACESLQGYYGVVGVFGGNPAIHPQFEELCKIMRGILPFEQRGLWCNHLRGNGAACRITFNPAHSNLNVHLDREAYDEFLRDWPETRHYLKGLDPAWPEAKRLGRERVGDSRHSPPWVAMQDVVADEGKRWELISGCDVNQLWSSLICQIHGELRAYFCEIAAAQAMLHSHDPAWPMSGLPVTPDWWRKPMRDFIEQVRFHCHRCGHPLRGYGELAIGGTTEQVSETHQDIYRPKRPNRLVELVTDISQLKQGRIVRATDYVQNGSIK